MRTLLLALFAASAFAQSTFTITKTAANEQDLSTTISAAAIPNQIAAIENTAPGSPFPGVTKGGGWPNSAGAIPVNTTLAAAVTTTGQTSITLTSAASLQVCNGLLIGSEMMLVTAVNSNVATVIRGVIGTTAATYTNGSPVTVTRVGGGTCMLKAILADAVGSMLSQQLQGTAMQAQAAAIATANAAIATAVTASIQ